MGECIGKLNEDLLLQKSNLQWFLLFDPMKPLHSTVKYMIEEFVNWKLKREQLSFRQQNYVYKFSHKPNLIAKIIFRFTPFCLVQPLPKRKLSRYIACVRQ
jgi:hypothetical protein